MSAFSKLLVKLMFNRIIHFIDANNAKKNHTTIQQIIYLLNHIGDVNNKQSPDLTMGIFY